MVFMEENRCSPSFGSRSCHLRPCEESGWVRDVMENNCFDVDL